MKYVGDVQIQIFNRDTGEYEPQGDFLPPSRKIARELAQGRPWRIVKCDRPLKPEMKNHYREYEYPPKTRSDEYLGLS